MQQEIWSQIILGGAVAAALGAVIAGRISRSIKISEFRQAWINELRKDIADYVGAAHKWFRKYEQINDVAESDDKARLEREELLPITNDALIVLARIKLRFNPRKNRYQKEDDEFLFALDSLLNPGKLAPPNLESEWHKLADNAIQRARLILKREWEVTKQPGQWY